jgi:hypothetical protein
MGMAKRLYYRDFGYISAIGKALINPLEEFVPVEWAQTVAQIRML